MTELIIRAQQFESPSEALAHYGVKGMRWGVRKDGQVDGVRKADRLEGVSRKTNNEAAEDAAEFARAKMFYGQGAGTRRKLIKAKVEAKAKKDSNYKKAFEHHLDRQDLGKHAEKARTERRRKDATETTTKTIKGARRQLQGGFGPVSISAAVLASAVVLAKQNNIDQIMKDAAATKYKSHQTSRNNQRAVNDLLKDMGMK